MQSSYGGPGQGSKKGTALKVVGIGFAVLLLVGGLMTAFGVFKAVTCCSQFMELEGAMLEVQDRSYEFALALHEGDAARAHRLLSEEAQAEHSVGELEALIDQLGASLRASRPFPVIVDVDMDEDDLDWSMMSGEISEWRSATHFRAPEDDEVLLLSLRVNTEKLGDGDDVEWRSEISGWDFDGTRQDVELNPSAEMARRFYRFVREEEWERALMQVGWDRQGGMDARAEAEQWMREMRRDMVRGEAQAVALHPVDARTMTVQLEVRGGGQVQRIDLQIDPNYQQVLSVSLRDWQVLEADEGESGEADGDTEGAEEAGEAGDEDPGEDEEEG